MPRKQEATAPQVLAYFKTAPIDAARLVLSLAKGEVETRSPKVLRRKEPITMPEPKGPPAQAPPTGARRRQAPAPSKEADVPLPGMVPVVGG